MKEFLVVTRLGVATRGTELFDTLDRGVTQPCEFDLYMLDHDLLMVNEVNPRDGSVFYVESKEVGYDPTPETRMARLTAFLGKYMKDENGMFSLLSGEDKHRGWFSLGYGEEAFTHDLDRKW